MSNPGRPSIDAVLAHGPWLRRLAGALVDEATADDLVQETWLRTLRRPPSLEQSPRPWLQRVLHNARFMQQRSRHRRERREERSAEASPPATAVDDIVARAQQFRIVEDLLHDLDEPYRRTILLHYFEERTAAEIATAEGVAPGTIRWRLKTGLDRLRDALDRRHGGDRGTWCAALLPAALPSSAHTGSGAAGVIAMKLSTKVLLASGVFAAGLTVTAVAVSAPDRPEPASKRAAVAEPGTRENRPAADDEAPETKTVEAPPAPRRTVKRFVNHQARERFIERIERARRRRLAAARADAESADAAAPQAGPGAPVDDEERKARVQQAVNEDFVPLVTECVELTSSAPGFAGELYFDIAARGEPEVGAVIETVDMTPGDGAPLLPDLAECIRESAYTMQLPPPDDGGTLTFNMSIEVDIPGTGEPAE